MVSKSTPRVVKGRNQRGGASGKDGCMRHNVPFLVGFAPVVACCFTKSIFRKNKKDAPLVRAPHINKQYVHVGAALHWKTPMTAVRIFTVRPGTFCEKAPSAAPPFACFAGPRTLRTLLIFTAPLTYLRLIIAYAQTRCQHRKSFEQGNCELQV
jgi:hypothetical protein